MLWQNYVDTRSPADRACIASVLDRGAAMIEAKTRWELHIEAQ